jgi:ABC-type dipeptide/oligopeptide/nickel transport system permease subunit
MVTSPWIVPHDPNALDLTARLQAPSAQHWFGTDEVGRDLFSRVLVGSQQSITAGLAVVVIAGGIGSLLGCLSGVLGGRGDAIIMRVMDIMLSIPSLVLTMALAAALARACLTPCWRLRLCAFRFTSAWRAGRRWWCASLPMCRPPGPLAHRAGT